MKIEINNENNKDNKFSYKVIKKIAKLGKKGKYTIELRYISWNDGPPKYDIRPWYIDEECTETMGKGISLTGSQLQKLKDVLNKEDDECE